MNNHTSLLRGDGLRSEASSEGFGTNDAARSQPARVLLIDDDHAIRHMVGTYLADHNMHVVSASGRDEVAQQLAFRGPSLVILDLLLGQEDGLNLLREIRSRSDIPIIIITGHRPDEM